MNPSKVDQLKIENRVRRRPQRFLWIILFGVLVLTGVSVYFGVVAQEGSRRLMKGTEMTTAAELDKRRAQSRSGAGLIVSGYIINKERIELSPRFMGTVKWIGVKKGDAVTNGQVVVLLDDAEQRARVQEAEGHVASSKAALERADLQYRRVTALAKDKITSRETEDEARIAYAAARAAVQEAEGQLALAKTYLDWTIIKSPIDGVVLEKLVDPNELVVPQSFGGPRGPSTALIALANPQELQVEVDVNESDLPKVRLNQKCSVSPEAYPDRKYDGFVAEIAPEANRQKGTLQVKVQVKNPDRFLTPELSAKVDFLEDATTTSAGAPATAAR